MAAKKQSTRQASQAICARGKPAAVAASTSAVALRAQAHAHEAQPAPNFAPALMRDCLSQKHLPFTSRRCLYDRPSS
jgi:hypothetical protein